MTLIFVYNANSGKLNALLDAGHKLISPSTYPCSLCALTYETLSENKTWKSFRKNSTFDMKFYHKDEFEMIYPNTAIDYPAVLQESKNSLSLILDSDTLHNLCDVKSLINKLNTKI